MERIHRLNARVILANKSGQALLFNANETLRDGSQRTVWFPPGGSAEGNEDFVSAAVRELMEETGLSVRPEQLGTPVAVRQGELGALDAVYWVDQVYYYLQADVTTVDTSRFTDLEREVIFGHHWWTVAELRATKELVFPPGLAALLERLLAGDIPSQPVELPWEYPR